MILERLPLLLAAAILLIAGAIRQHDDNSDGLIGAGFVVLGAWLAIEVEHLWQQHKREADKP